MPSLRRRRRNRRVITLVSFDASGLERRAFQLWNYMLEVAATFIMLFNQSNLPTDIVIRASILSLVYDYLQRHVIIQVQHHHQGQRDEEVEDDEMMMILAWIILPAMTACLSMLFLAVTMLLRLWHPAVEGVMLSLILIDCLLPMAAAAALAITGLFVLSWTHHACLMLLCTVWLTSCSRCIRCALRSTP